jgi:hypothetical protein
MEGDVIFELGLESVGKLRSKDNTKPAISTIHILTLLRRSAPECVRPKKWLDEIKPWQELGDNNENIEVG